MKKPNIDFSKQGMKRFFLYHVEKVIFGVAIIALGVLFWLGLGTKKFSDQTPQGLEQLSAKAHTKMVNASSWTEIETFRKADADAASRIENLEKVVIAPKDYKYETLLGTKAMTAGLRLDPMILPAEHLMAFSFPATVLLTKNGGSDAVSDLPFAGEDDEEDLAGSGGIGAGGGAGLEGDDQPAEREKPAKKERDDGKLKPGSEVPGYQLQEMPGIRPRKVRVNSANSKAWMCNVVAVSGVVRFEDQSAEYASAFSGARGYYRKRDRPVYQYLQVERMKEGSDEWEDITDKIDNIQVDRFVTEAPEVVDPEYYDAVLTSAIPTITQMDYRNFASWPIIGFELPAGFKAPQEGFTGIPLRNFLKYPDESDEPEEKSDEDSEDPFASGPKGKADDNKKKGGQGRMGGLGGGRRPPRGANRGRPSGTTVNLGERVGNNPELYEAAMESLGTRGALRLVRFFDVQPVRSIDAKPQKYKYRVRLWLQDANNEPEGGFEKLEADNKRGSGGRGIGAGGAGLEGGEGAGGAPPSNSGGSNKDDEEDTSVWVAVTDVMKAPDVRSRIDRDKARELPDDRDDLAYSIVSEWSEPTDWVTVGESHFAEFYAGKIVPPKATRIRNDYIGDGEAVVNIATAVWNPDFGIHVPANREARRADVLNFQAHAHVLHPTDWSVRLVENAEIDTDATIVDIMGGEEIRDLSSARSPIKYNLPGEVLVMTSDGNLHVQNDIDDKQGYLHLLFQEDETAEFGRKKTKKTKDKAPGRGDRGGDGPGR